MTRPKALLQAFLYALAFMIAIGLSSLFIGYAIGSEDRKRVIIIDTGLDLNDERFTPYLCKDGKHKDFTRGGVKDILGHGTHVAGLIILNAPQVDQYCITVIKYTDGGSNGVLNTKRFFKAIAYAATLNPYILSLSVDSDSSKDAKEINILKRFKRIVLASGNSGKNLDEVLLYPVRYDLPNAQVVGNFDCGNVEGPRRNPSSNYGSMVTYECGTAVKSYRIGNGFKDMTGSSMAVPVRVAKILDKEYSH